MRITQCILLILIALTFSCQQKKVKAKTEKQSKDSYEYQGNIELIEKTPEKLAAYRQEIRNQEIKDSIELRLILKEALGKANKRINQEQFKLYYQRLISDSSMQVDVEINLNNHFFKNKSHLIIKRNTPYAIYIDIYIKNDSVFRKVLSHEHWQIEYQNDTIRDINGDSLNDFVVNWYGSSGCCLKGFSDVYLLKHDSITFTKKFEFINPTFSPKEKVVRGVCYGHPGETEIYKYKWKNYHIDTVEYVYFEKDSTGEKTGKIILSTRTPYNKRNKIKRKRNSVPTEYQKIDGYSWFLGR